MQAFTEASSNLARCSCGSKVIMRYDPGCTYVVCIAERETKEAVADWQPEEMLRVWNEDISNCN